MSSQFPNRTECPKCHCQTLPKFSGEMTAAACQNCGYIQERFVVCLITGVTCKMQCQEFGGNCRLKEEEVKPSTIKEEFEALDKKEQPIVSNISGAKSSTIDCEGVGQIPWESLKQLGAIFKEGEAKHGRGNWKKAVSDIPYQQERWEHAERHLRLYNEGDRSENHMAKVMWYACVQIWWDHKWEKMNRVNPDPDVQKYGEKLNATKK